MSSADKTSPPPAVTVPSPLLAELDVPIAIRNTNQGKSTPDVYSYDDQPPYDQPSVETEQSYAPGAQGMQPQLDYSNHYPPIHHEMQPLPDYSDRHPPIQQEMHPQQNYPNRYPPMQHGLQPQQDYSNRYSGYLGCSIFVCLCCAWPCGIFAIRFSNEASAAAKRGDLAAGEGAASKARLCIGMSVVFGIVAIIITVVYYQTSY